MQSISSLANKFERVTFFLSRACQVIVLLVKQMCALLGKKFFTGNSTTCFPVRQSIFFKETCLKYELLQEPLDCLAELLVSLLMLEYVLINGVIKENWIYYRKAVRSMLHNPAQFGISSDNLRCLYKRLGDIDSELLTGKILQV